MDPGGTAIALGLILATAQADIPVFDVRDTVRVEARRQWMPRPQVSLLYESLRPSLRSPGLLKAWYLMGAGAAVGAILGSVSAGGNSRVQIRATASPPAP